MNNIDIINDLIIDAKLDDINYILVKKLLNDFLNSDKTNKDFN